MLARKRIAGETPTLVSVAADLLVRDAVSLLHDHQVSQLPVVDAADPSSVIGSVGERGMLKHAARRPRAARRADLKGDGAAVPDRVGADDPARDAVELLVGDQTGAVGDP